MMTRLVSTRLAFASLSLCVVVSTAWADPSIPTTQSQCEIAAIKFATDHPKASMEEYTKLGFSFFDLAIPPKPPTSYRDPVSGIIFYVESDGRHITAISPKGQVQWVRNPFVDADLCPYRSAHPFIERIVQISNPVHPDPRLRTDEGANAFYREMLRRQIDFLIKNRRLKEKLRANDRILELIFNSSQFGYLNVRNGDFYYAGQN